MSVKLTISFVEDDDETREFLRRSFAKLPDFTVLDAFPDAETALAGLANRQPKILVADWHLPDRNGLHLIGDARDLYPGICNILITGYDLDHLPLEALRCGAAGFLYKFEQPLNLPARVREIHAGKAVPTPLVAEKLAAALQAEAAASHALLHKLTRAERKALLACRSGQPEKQLAAELGITPGTLRNQLSSAFVKLGVHGLLEACQKVWPTIVSPWPTSGRFPASRAFHLLGSERKTVTTLSGSPVQEMPSKSATSLASGIRP